MWGTLRLTGARQVMPRAESRGQRSIFTGLVFSVWEASLPVNYLLW